MATIGTLAGGKLGSSLATLYSVPALQRAHAFVNLANSSTANSYSVNISVCRSGTTTDLLVIGAGTLILAASSSNTGSGQLVVPDHLTGLKLSSGDSLKGSASTDAVVHYLIHGGVET